MIGKSVEELKVGDRAAFSKAFKTWHAGLKFAKEWLDAAADRL